MDYNNYLKSDKWKRKRRNKINVSSQKCCAICLSRNNLQVHHLSYKPNLDDVPNWDLRILCDTCHKTTHELIDSGDIKFDNLRRKRENHNNRFRITLKAVRKKLGLSVQKFDLAILKIKEYKRLSNKKFQVLHPETTQVLTEEILDSGKSIQGAWNLAQLRLFGFNNFTKGWKWMIIGSEWPSETIAQFLFLKNNHLKT